MASIVKINTYLTDIRHRQDLIPVRERVLRQEGPASTLVAVAALAQPNGSSKSKPSPSSEAHESVIDINPYIFRAYVAVRAEARHEPKASGTMRRGLNRS